MDGISSITCGTTNSGASTTKVMNEANKCIQKWNLRELGWRGFQQLDWVTDITNKYPEAVNIAHTCSTQNGSNYMEQVQDLFDNAKSADDKKELHNYFMGKLGLEHLSCLGSGAAGGLCDKKGAFINICTLTSQLVKQG